MSPTTAPAYRIVSNIQVVQFDVPLQQTVAGHEIKALWFATQGVVTVFVPDTLYSVENVDQLIREQGAKASAVAALGG